MNPLNGIARVLLIADDRESGERYRNALAGGGYEVFQAESFLGALGTPGLDPDVIVLCDLAVLGLGRDDAGCARRRGSSPCRAARDSPRHHGAGCLTRRSPAISRRSREWSAG